MKSRLVKGLGRKRRKKKKKSRARAKVATAAAAPSTAALYPDGLDTSTTWGAGDTCNVPWSRKWKDIIAGSENAHISSVGGPTDPLKASKGTASSRSRPPLQPRNDRNDKASAKIKTKTERNPAEGNENNHDSDNRLPPPPPENNVPHEHDASSTNTVPYPHNNFDSSDQHHHQKPVEIDIGTPRVRNSSMVDLDDISFSDYSTCCGTAGPAAAAVRLRPLLRAPIDLDQSFSDDDDYYDDGGNDVYGDDVGAEKKQHTHADQSQKPDAISNADRNSSAFSSISRMSTIPFASMDTDIVSGLRECMIHDRNNPIAQKAERLLDVERNKECNFRRARRNEANKMAQRQQLNTSKTTTKERSSGGSKNWWGSKVESVRSLQSEATRVVDNRSFTLNSSNECEV